MPIDREELFGGFASVPQTISFRANALNSRGIVGAGNPGRFAADFLVADAVLPNRSPKGFFSVTGNLLQNEAKNRGCRLPWDT